MTMEDGKNSKPLNDSESTNNNKLTDENVNKFESGANKMENSDNTEGNGEVNRSFLTDDGKNVELGNDSNSKIKNGHMDEEMKKIENGVESKENVGKIENGLIGTERGIDVQKSAKGHEGGMREDGKKTKEGRKKAECGKTEEVRIEEGAEKKLCGRRTPMWLTRVRKDLVKKQFIPIKVLYLLLFGAMMCLFPFLTLQARSLGITEKELSLLFALNPIVAFVGPPLTGILADKIGNFKLLLSVLMATSGALGLGYLMVPEARRVVPLPSHLPYTLTTTSQAHPDHSTAPTLALAPPHVCHYQPNVTNFTVSVTNCTLCNGYGTESVVDMGDGGAVEVQVLREGVEPNTTTTLLVTAWPRTLTTLSKATGVRQAADNEAKAGDAEDCVVMCYGGVSSTGLCTNTNTTQELSPSATFFTYMAVRLVGGITLATSHTMLEGATMAILREYKGDLGLQRLYGNIGAIVMTPVSGVLIDVVSGISGRQDFRPAFYLYFGLKLVAAMVIMLMDLDFRMPSDKVTKDFKELLKNAEVITFLVVMLITGAFFGLLDTFLFWLLQDLGAKKSLMGITVTVGTSAGIPVLVASGYIINKLGHANTIIMGLAFYVIRMIGYSFLTNPWWCMPFEVLECFTVSLLGTASSCYADDLATPATIATLQGMQGGIQHGVGRAFGSLIGGFLIAPLGIRLTFRLAAGVSAVTCVIYFVANRFFFRKQQEERRKAKELQLREGTEGECNGTEAKKNVDVKCDGENKKNEDKDAERDADVKDVGTEKKCEGVVTGKLQDKDVESNTATTVENNDADDNLAHKEDITKTPKEINTALEDSIIGSDKNMKVEGNLDRNDKVSDRKLEGREYHNPAYEGD